MEFALWPPAYNELADAQRFYRELIDGVEEVPGVSWGCRSPDDPGRPPGSLPPAARVMRVDPARSLRS
jgi:hypothetical protein